MVITISYQRFGALALTLSVLVGPALSGRAIAHAEPSVEDRAAARGLFDEGREAMRVGEVEQGCAKLEASRALVDGVGIAYHLASCYEQLGRTASAWALYRDVAARTRSAGQHEREIEARRRAERLEPQLSKLRIDVAATTEAMSVRRDGGVVAPESWGTDLVVDPGTHRVEAFVGEELSFRRDVEVAGDADLVVVRVQDERERAVKSTEAPPVATPPAPARAVQQSTPQLPPALMPDTRHEALQPIGWALLGTGVAATAIGFGVYGGGANKVSQAEARCGGDVESCSDVAATELAEQGERMKRAGLPMGIAGSAGLLAGIVTLIAYGEASQQSEQDAVLFAVSADGASAGVRLRF